MGNGEWVLLVVGALAIGFMLGVHYASWIAEKTIERIERGFAALMQGYAESLRLIAGEVVDEGEERPAP